LKKDYLQVKKWILLS